MAELIRVMENVHGLISQEEFDRLLNELMLLEAEEEFDKVDHSIRIAEIRKRLGLKRRTREENYIVLVNAEAAKHGATFYVNCGEGREFINRYYDGEDISGWLIPDDKNQEFESELATIPKGRVLSAVVDEKWDDYFCTATWGLDDEVIKVSFEK